ncbi:MAG: hypothetical protein JOZ29_12455 [Deltaproteobacteria bacterium]|nr:hypothetical protein [Deltaproteobacteria bacterium]
MLSAILIAYLDTDAFDHIYKKIGCTGADIANLRKAIYGRQLSIRLSIHTLEEILLGRKVSPQALAAQIKLTLSLASSRTLVKSCAQLLFDDICAYAARGEADRPFLRGDMQNAVADGIAALIESDGEELEEDFLAVLDQARQEKQQFFAALEQVQREAEAISRPSSGWSGFEQYFEAAAHTALETLVERAGVANRCRERGLDGLLKIKSVRMSLCAGVARGYEQAAVGAAVNSTTLHHPVSAAAVAETFVSDFAANREFLARLPIEGLNAITLPEFLKRL